MPSDELPLPHTLFLPALLAGLEGSDAAGRRLLLAVSGGADSVALMCGCRTLADRLNLSLSVAHFNHRLRSEESDADAGWVESFGNRLGLTVVVGNASVATAGESSGIEEAARKDRYRFLCQTAMDLGCHAVATAHTADDQAETVLHHILRGTGLAGLRGMQPRRPMIGSEVAGVTLIRPMLSIRRAAVVSWLGELGQDYRTDSSNYDRKFTRNRIRHDVLPLLAESVSPTVVESLLRLRATAQDVDEALTILADRLLHEATTHVDSDTKCRRLDCRPFDDQPRHLVRECFVRLWVHSGWPRQSMRFAHWESLADLAMRPLTITDHAALTLPGNISCRRSGVELAIGKTR